MKRITCSTIFLLAVMIVSLLAPVSAQEDIVYGDPAGRFYGPPLPVQARHNPQIPPIRVLHSTRMQNPNLSASER